MRRFTIILLFLPFSVHGKQQNARPNLTFRINLLQNVFFSKITPCQCETLWWQNYMNDDVIKRDTSTFNNYKWLEINYPTHGKSQPLIVEFLHYLDSNYFANSTNKNPLVYFVKFEKFADGELGELYTDFYLRLFNYDTCDFFQLMKVRKENMTKNEFEDLSLLDLVFQEINDETMNKKRT